MRDPGNEVGVYTSLLLDTDELKMALRARKCPGLSRNGPQVTLAHHPGGLSKS